MQSVLLQDWAPFYFILFFSPESRVLGIENHERDRAEKELFPQNHS